MVTRWLFIGSLSIVGAGLVAGVIVLSQASTTVHAEKPATVSSVPDMPRFLQSLPQTGPSEAQGMMYQLTDATGTAVMASSTEVVPLPGERRVRVPVVMYHYVRPITPEMNDADRSLSVSPEHFTEQMKALIAAGYHTITPDDLYGAVEYGFPLPKKPVLLTFDDGYRDHYDTVFPILKQLNLKATFFIITGFESSPLYVSADMIKEMDASGLVTIAAHTRHHVPLPAVPFAEMKDEIEGSKKDLEQLLHHPVTSLAYPFGNADAYVIKETKAAGFTMAFSTLNGSLHAPSAIYMVRRVRSRDGVDMVKLLKAYSSR